MKVDLWKTLPHFSSTAVSDFSKMSSEGVPAVGQRLHRLFSWFDPESAAVVTILFGLIQVFLSVPLAYAEESIPKFYILPLILGIVIVAGGSLTMANERNPNRLLLKGCVCSNVAGLLVAMIAFGLYCYTLSVNNDTSHCGLFIHRSYYRDLPLECPKQVLMTYCWSVTLLLLLYDIGAMVLHSILSVSAIKTLKTD